MNGRRLLLSSFAMILATPALALAQAWTAEPMDWPMWRGPEQNGISREKNLPDSWNPKGEYLLWSKPELAARSTPIVMDGKLFVIKNDNPGTAEEGEKVVCADAETGEILWENKFNVFLSDVPNTRVGWSSVVGDPRTGYVYALSVCDVLYCIDGQTGRTLWQHSLSEEYGMLNTYGGRTNFPIVYEDLVIVSGIIIGWGDQAKPAHRFIAFEKTKGQPVWMQGTRPLPYDTGYSTPVTATIEGQVALVFGSGDGGVHAFQLRTGKPLWKYNVSKRGINTTPVIGDNGVVICGHSEDNIDNTTMGALFALDGTATGDITKSGEIWRNVGWTVGKTAPLIVGGRVYAVGDFGNFYVADLETGKEIDSKKIGTAARCSPLYADGKLYTADVNGRCWIFRPVEEGLERVEAFRLRNEQVDASPIVSHGKLYLTTSANMYCFGRKDVRPEADQRPPVPPEADDRDEGPAQLQLVPAESLLMPQQKQPYQVRFYSKAGVYIRTVPLNEVEFSVEGPGKIGSDGKYIPDETVRHYGATVTAKAGGLTGSARIRVVPPLPWKIDFSRGEIPESWVGIRYRNVHIDFDFLQKLKAANPTAASLYIYLQTDFVNNATDRVVWDNSTPRQLLAGFYTYMDIADQVASLDDAKSRLNDGLDLLVAEKYLASYEWENVEGKGPTFRAVRGGRKDDGNIVMMKITTIPKGARSQGWMGRTTSKDYTTQADVRGNLRNAKMPDIGVTAQRYRMEILGESQEIKLVSWIAHEIKYKKQPFAWKPDVWYTMKLQATAEQREGKAVAVLKGKVWPRDESEPAEWTIEWEDEPGNEQGSPGLFGNAKDAEIFYDNIIVTPNAG